MKNNRLKIDGIIELNGMNVTEFTDKLFKFLESENCFFAGSYEETNLDQDETSVKILGGRIEITKSCDGDGMILVISDPTVTSNKDWVDISFADVVTIVNILRTLGQDIENTLSSWEETFYNKNDVIAEINMATGSTAKFTLLDYLSCPEIQLDIYDNEKELKYTEEFCVDAIAEDLEMIESLFDK